MKDKYQITSYCDRHTKSHGSWGHEHWCRDFGIYLADRIKAFFKNRKQEIALKYFDPSYSIRSTPANSVDSFYCTRLGAHAVHAAMAGKTGLIVSFLHSRFVHVPIELATAERKTVDPEGPLWLAVLESTGQPMKMTN